MAVCTIVILTFKGKHHLTLLLPTVREALACYQGGDSINVMIVDNGSDQKTKQFVNDEFPEFTYAFSPVNDYLFSLNGFIRELKTEYLLMLNDDMKMEKNILNELIPIMKADQSLFAATCRIMDFEGSYTVSSVRKARYSKGWMYNYYLDPGESETRYTLYPGGGAAIFRTDFFNVLNGFDDLFRPAYCEDTDLGIRAWQRGWKTIYHPAAVLYHREGGTMADQFKKDKLEQTIFKNQVLCMVKNTQIPGFIIWFFTLLPYRILVSFFKNRNQFKAWMLAVRQMSRAMARRTHNNPSGNDKAWIRLLNITYPDGGN